MRSKTLECICFAFRFAIWLFVLTNDTPAKKRARQFAHHRLLLFRQKQSLINDADTDARLGTNCTTNGRTIANFISFALADENGFHYNNDIKSETLRASTLSESPAEPKVESEAPVRAHRHAHASEVTKVPAS